jgi:hypothetical protein
MSDQPNSAQPTQPSTEQSAAPEARENAIPDRFFTGGRQFLSGRTEILTQFDRARELNSSRPVQTEHGNVGEAQIRKWLTDFLPQKYGVTSGFVVSQALSEDDRVPHFDVVIYDRLEAPVIWTTNNADNSEQGKSRAIPAEHVLCVLEVKSRYNASTARDALSHLQELQPMLSKLDDENERYKSFLPGGFRCGAVFMELDPNCPITVTPLTALSPGFDLRGFFGGAILRGHHSDASSTGRLELLVGDTPNANGFCMPGLGLSSNFAMTGPIRSDVTGRDFLVNLRWGRSEFGMLAFDLLAMLNGTYQGGRVSSFFGLLLG